MSHEYERVETPASGLRLHLNENTAGCSPRVIAAIQELTREQMAFYPGYGRAEAACAERFGVPADHLLLTNGMDEGILATSIVALRGGPGNEAIVVEPAFDMYASCADGAGGTVVTILPDDNLSFPLMKVLDAIGASTTLVFDEPITRDGRRFRHAPPHHRARLHALGSRRGLHRLRRTSLPPEVCRAGSRTSSSGGRSQGHGLPACAPARFSAGHARAAHRVVHRSR